MKYVATLTFKKKSESGNIYKLDKIGEKLPGSTTIEELQNWVDKKCADNGYEFVKLEINKS